MHSHLCRDRKDKSLRGCRWFLNWGGDLESGLSIEWNVLSRLASSFKLNLLWNHDEEGKIGFSIGIPLLFSIWVLYDGGWKSWLSKWARKAKCSRDTGFSLSFFDGMGFCQIFLFGNSDDWSRSKERRFLGFPWHTGHRGGVWSFHPVDVILGRGENKKVGADQAFVGWSVQMPEGPYPVDIVIEKRRWKRSRWFAGRVFTYANVDVQAKGGIPFPGKGENSWDCGMDGLYGSSFPAEDMGPKEIVNKVQHDVMETRLKRAGNRLWVPEKAAAGGRGR